MIELLIATALISATCAIGAWIADYLIPAYDAWISRKIEADYRAGGN